MKQKLWIATGRLLYWLAWPGLYVYFRINKHRTRVIIENGGRIVVVKRWLGNGKWLLPGGGLKDKEDAKAAAVREVIEETSIWLQPSDLKLVMESSLKEEGFSFFCTAFSVSLPQANQPVKQGMEITEVGWVSAEEALTHPHVSASAKAILSNWKARP